MNLGIFILNLKFYSKREWLNVFDPNLLVNIFLIFDTQTNFLEKIKIYNINIYIYIYILFILFN